MTDLCLNPDQTKNVSVINSSQWSIEKYTVRFTCDLVGIPDGYTRDTGVLTVVENLPAGNNASKEICRLTGGAPIFVTQVEYALKFYRYSGGKRRTHETAGVYTAKQVGVDYLQNYNTDVKPGMSAEADADGVDVVPSTAESAAT